MSISRTAVLHRPVQLTRRTSSSTTSTKASENRRLALSVYIHYVHVNSRGEFHGSLRRDKAAVSTENTSTLNTCNKPSVCSLSLYMYTVILSTMSKCVLQ